MPQSNRARISDTPPPAAPHPNIGRADDDPPSAPCADTAGAEEGLRTTVLPGEGWPAGDFPAAPYPGVMPDFSFLAAGLPGRVWPLLPDPDTPSGWRLAPADSTGPAVHDGRQDDPTGPIAGAELDAVLTANGEIPLAQRIPVLAYGSNRCPEKIDWLRTELGLRGTVVAIRVRTTGLAAVWAAGLRTRDDQRPATLSAADTVEEHVVWWCTPEQVEVLDVCEVRGRHYQLARLRSGTAVDVAGRRYPELYAYTGLPSGAGGDEDTVGSRMPLLVDGAPVRCVEVLQAAARALIGTTGSTDRLDLSVVDDAPDPVEWPREVFVYGTLQPGDTAWRRLEPFAAGAPRRTAVRGALLDTGHGYPALTLAVPPTSSATASPSPESTPPSSTSPGAEQAVPGWAVPLRDPAAAFATLDAYEGPQYERVRTTAIDGAPCWTYLWLPQVDGMTVLSDGWRPRRRTTE